ANRGDAGPLAVVEGPPDPLEAVQPRVPGDLLAIVTRAMARNPDDRYPSAQELAADLVRFQTGRLVGARHYSVRARFGRWLWRRRLIIGPIALATVLAIVSTVWIRDAQRRATQNEERAEQESLRASDAQAKTQRTELQRRAAELERETAELQRR